MDIHEMQFGFLPVTSTTDSIFVVRQLQEMFLLKKKTVRQLGSSKKSSLGRKISCILCLLI